MEEREIEEMPFDRLRIYATLRRDEGALSTRFNRGLRRR